MNFRKSDLRKKHVGNLMDRKNRAGYLFIAPFLFGMLFIFLPALAESFKYSLEFAAIKFNYVEQEYIGFENYVEAVTNDTDFLPMLYSAIRGTLVDLVVILFFSFFICQRSQPEVYRQRRREDYFLPSRACGNWNL